jgi:membrane-bound lytic murein transglycosylase A
MNTSVKASFFIKSGTHQTQNTRWAAACMAVAMALGGCSPTSQRPLTPSVPPVAPPTAPAEPVVWDADVAQAMAWADEQPLPPPIARTRSLWQPVSWTTLPGLQRDDWHQAWHAWVRSCERPPAVWQGICRELRPQLLGTPASQLAWMVRNLQPYRVVNPDGTEPPGLLTGYYEPVMQASRVRTPTHTVPLYGPPPGWPSGNRGFRGVTSTPDPTCRHNWQDARWLG